MRYRLVVGTNQSMSTCGRVPFAGEIVVPVAQWYSQVEKEKHRLANEWMPLARFSLADELYRGSFVIRHDDLVAGRLDKALSVTEFSE